jgi:hypothetical protein
VNMTNTSDRPNLDSTLPMPVPASYLPGTWHIFHQWIAEDDTVSCLACGAVYLTDDETGEPYGYKGDAPSECLAELSPVHGWRDENGHDMECPGGRDGSCRRCNFPCNGMCCT